MSSQTTPGGLDRRACKCAPVRLSHRLGSLYPLNEPEQIGCVTTIQKLARFELVIYRMEAVYGFKQLCGIPEQPGDYAYLWVLGAYEIVRTLAEKTKYPSIVQAKKLFERIRVPLAKLEASRNYKKADFNFTFPAVLPGACFGAGWAINQNEIILRTSLSCELFDALSQFGQIESERPVG